MARQHRRVRATHGGQQRSAPVFLAALSSIPPPLHPAVYRILRTRPRCLLCGGRFYAVGAFVPPDPQAWGRAEPGWHYGCVFGLCRGCVALPDRPARVETALGQERARAHARWN